MSILYNLFITYRVSTNTRFFEICLNLNFIVLTLLFPLVKLVIKFVCCVTVASPPSNKYALSMYHGFYVDWIILSKLPWLNACPHCVTRRTPDDTYPWLYVVMVNNILATSHYSTVSAVVKGLFYKPAHQTIVICISTWIFVSCFLSVADASRTRVVSVGCLYLWTLHAFIKYQSTTCRRLKYFQTRTPNF